MTYLTANLSLYQLRINLLVRSVTWCSSLLMPMCISHYWRTANLQHPDTLENLVIVKKKSHSSHSPQTTMRVCLSQHTFREKKTDGTYLRQHYSEMSFPRGPKPWSTHLFVWRTPCSPGSSWTPKPQGPYILLCQPTGEEIGESSWVEIVIHVLDSTVI